MSTSVVMLLNLGVKRHWRKRSITLARWLNNVNQNKGHNLGILLCRYLGESANLQLAHHTDICDLAPIEFNWNWNFLLEQTMLTNKQYYTIFAMR